MLIFGKAVNGFVQPVAMLMGEAIKAGIKISVIHAERTRQVEHHTASLEKFRRQIVADFVGRRQEHHIHLVCPLGRAAQRLQRQVHHAFQLRMQIRQRLSGIRALR